MNLFGIREGYFKRIGHILTAFFDNFYSLAPRLPAGLRLLSRRELVPRARRDRPHDDDGKGEDLFYFGYTCISTVALYISESPDQVTSKR
jgi:hypothetical protein